MAANHDDAQKLEAIQRAVRVAILEIFHPGYLDAASSAAYISVSPRAFETISKQIPTIRLTESGAGKRLFKKTDLDEYMARHRQMPKGEVQPVADDVAQSRSVK